MNKKIAYLSSIIITTFILGALTAGCGNGNAKIQAEPPEDVVKRFYAYVNEGGPTTLGEAYRLISTKHYTLPEDRFKDIVSKYSKDMKINVVKSEIMKDRAVVTIEYKIPSTFGGDYVANTDINLDFDEKTNKWKIDFTGETQADTRQESAPVAERKDK